MGLRVDGGALQQGSHAQQPHAQRDEAADELTREVTLRLHLVVVVLGYT